jgi:predicted porin
MKTSILALALLGAITGTASAQSSVTVYGLVDMALMRESGAATGPSTKISSGVASGSRIGFKGKEDLGGGLSAIFLLENGFQADTGTIGQGGVLFGRQLYLGLQGSLGTVTMGRQYTPQYLTVVMVDPFGSGMAGDTKNLMPATGSGSRVDNSIEYASPVVNGMNAELLYAPGEIAGSSSASRQLGGALGYAAGPLKIRLGYHYRNNDTALLKNIAPAKNTVLAATYDFGAAKVHFAYATNEGVNSSPLRNAGNPFGYAMAPVASVDSQDLLAGLTIPFGAHTLMASYIRKHDKTSLDQSANQAAIGYRYALSKRTDVYSSYARIDNTNGAGYTIGNASEGGTGDSTFNVGIRHIF